MQPKKEDGVFFFNQWKIGLQCCVGFCQTTSQIIHNYIRWASLIAVGKESACNAGHLGLIPGLERFSGEGKGYPLQYSGMESSRDCIVHGVAKGQTQLRNFHFHFSLLYTCVCVCVCVCVCITSLLNHPLLPLSHSHRKPGWIQNCHI